MILNYFLTIIKLFRIKKFLLYILILIYSCIELLAGGINEDVFSQK